MAPLKPIQQLVFGWNNIISVSDSFGNGTTGYYNGHGGQYYGGF